MRQLSIKFSVIALVLSSSVSQVHATVTADANVFGHGAVRLNNAARAWNSDTSIWTPVILNAASDLVGSGGNFVLGRDSGATAWNHDTSSWTSTTIPGFKGSTDIVGSGGNFALLGQRRR